jgi:haloalkane dehalogenase
MNTSRLAPPPLPQWLERQVPFERMRIDTGAWRMHVMTSGRGPTVLMVHGNPTWGYLYRRVVKALGNGVRCVMPDLVGLGLSDKPRDPTVHSLWAHADWLGRALDQMDIGRYVLVVQDWGGPIGALASAARPGQLAGLVVLNTVLGPPRNGFRPTTFHRFSQTPVVSDIAFRAVGFPQIALATAQGDRHSIRGDVARAYRWPLRRIRDRTAPLALARMVPDSLSHPSIEPLTEVAQYVDSLDVPTAIVWGRRDPVLGGVLNHMKRTLPDAWVQTTPAGHFLQEEVPEEIAAAVRHVVARATF